ncbi:mechanosensitive ion channel family protein, partial [Candidatus Parcubacteria bacterium]
MNNSLLHQFPFLERVVFGNAVWAYLLSFFIFLALTLVFAIFQKVLLTRLERLAKKTKTDIDDAVIEIVGNIRPPFYFFLAFYLAISSLTIPEWLQKIIYAVLIIWIVALVVRATGIFVQHLFKKVATKEHKRGTQAALLTASRVVQGVLWAIGILLVLSNLGFDVSSLIAGLGIGGIAVALAVQNILSDLFSSFTILVDKPFVPGDFIVVGEHMGVVEKIGIKTTRLRALQGEEIVISNRELTATRIQNFKRMKARRVLFRIGVVYETPSELLEQIPDLVRGIITRQKNVTFDRAHFSSFDDSSLTFEIVYYVNSG